MSVAFPKDLVLLDFESSIGDAHESVPVQLGAILLDKNTLEEKKHFVSFIRVDLDTIPEKRKKEKGYTPEKINAAPESAGVAKKFLQTFGKDYFIASWAANLDMKMFIKLMGSAGVSFTEFDYHVYDLWPVAYTYLLKRGYRGSAKSEEMFHEFGLPARGIHNALEDCRLEAEVLRKIMKDL